MFFFVFFLSVLPEKWFQDFSATRWDEKSTDGSFESSFNSPEVIFLRFLIFTTVGARARKNLFLAPKLRSSISRQPEGIRGWDIAHSKALIILHVLTKNNFNSFCHFQDIQKNCFPWYCIGGSVNQGPALFFLKCRPSFLTYREFIVVYLLQTR